MGHADNAVTGLEGAADCVYLGLSHLQEAQGQFDQAAGLIANAGDAYRAWAGQFQQVNSVLAEQSAIVQARHGDVKDEAQRLAAS